MSDSNNLSPSLSDFQAVAQARPAQAVPSAIHTLNVTGIIAWAGIVIPAAVVQPYHLALLAPAFIALAALYWLFRGKRAVAATFLGLFMAAVVWVAFCENIAVVDDVFGTQIARRLQLGLRLQNYFENRIAAGGQHFQQCCGDPVTYNRQPGAQHKSFYDCPDCLKPYETVVDEIGFLNRQIGLYRGNARIDLFFAGDSVLQGYGMPSVLENVKGQIPLTMWNLSVNGYGPRQKVSALIAYALPKQPRWLILDFFSGNDAQDAIETRMCVEEKDYHCLYNAAFLRRELLNHPVFGAMMTHKPEWIEILHDATMDNFTLAVTRYVINNFKGFARDLLELKKTQKFRNNEKPTRYVPWPWKSNYEELKPERMVEWFHAGLDITFESYDRLNVEINKNRIKPEVILVYNPSGYEIYRGLLADRGPKRDEISLFKVQALQNYAAKHGWIFLDLTPPLRDEIKKHGNWIYGRYDQTHWSREGTLFVGKILTAELKKIVTQ